MIPTEHATINKAIARAKSLKLGQSVTYPCLSESDAKWLHMLITSNSKNRAYGSTMRVLCTVDQMDSDSWNVTLKAEKIRSSTKR